MVSNCVFSVKPRFKSFLIVIRMGDTTFRATWDDTGDVGVVNLTKGELKEFTTSTGSEKGENITSMFENGAFSLLLRTVRSQTRSTNGNGPSVQIETEV